MRLTAGHSDSPQSLLARCEEYYRSLNNLKAETLRRAYFFTIVDRLKSERFASFGDGDDSISLWAQKILAGIRKLTRPSPILESWTTRP